MRTLACLAAALAAGCGGTATLNLKLTDAPPDTAAMSAVVVTLSRVEAHVAKADDADKEVTDASIDGDDRWVEVPLASREFDLLALQNDVTAPLGETEVGEGKVTQIRLFIDEAGVNEVRLLGGQVCPLDLKAVSKGGIKINHPFKALETREGATTTVVVDFDVKESVDQDGACAFALKPVIKVKEEKSGVVED